MSNGSANFIDAALSLGTAFLMESITEQPFILLNLSKDMIINSDHIHS